VDEKGREIILTIHWQGGQHSQLRIRKPGTGEHGRRTSEEALAVIRSMSCRWSDQDIAASLNRMGMRTGQAAVPKYTWIEIVFQLTFDLWVGYIRFDRASG
jgi:hypothetical protein